MTWPILILAALAAWCLLQVLADDRAGRMRTLQDRILAASRPPASPSHTSEPILTVGGPVPNKSIN